MEYIKSDEDDIAIPAMLPLLALRDTVAFPGMSIPLLVGRKKSLKAVDIAIKSDRLLVLSAQREKTVEDPGTGDIYEVGTVGRLVRTLPTSDGKLKILVQTTSRCTILGFTGRKSFLQATIRLLFEAASGDIEYSRKMVSNVHEILDEAFFSGLKIPAELMAVIENEEDPSKLSYLVASCIGLDVARQQEILFMPDPLERLDLLMKWLDEIIRSLRKE